MVRTQFMTAVLRSRNLNLTKRKAAQPKSKRKAAQLKRAAAAAAASSEEQKMMAALRAVDVEKILRLKKEAVEAMETKCFPMTARAKLAAAAAKAKMAAAAAGQTSEEEKAPEKKKKVVTHLVSQRYIDYMKEAGLFDCVDAIIPEEELAKRSELFREGYRSCVLLNEKIQACQQVLLDQYNVFGYAYDAKEVTDDEGEDDDDDGELVVKN